MKSVKYGKTYYVTLTAMIAVLYIVLTYFSSLLGLDKFVIQFRPGEALTILPVFTSAAVPGLTVGCFLSGLITGAEPFDMIFGTLATLVGAVGTYLLRKKHPIIAVIPQILANTVAVPLILAYVYHLEGAIWYFALFVFLSESLSAGFGGYLLYRFCRKTEILK